MGRGHGSSRGGGGASGAGRDGYSAGLTKALSERETEIRTKGTERITAFDENGNKLYENNKGFVGAVSLPKDIKSLENSVITHNHPEFKKSKRRSDEGGSFSSDDWNVMTLANAKEMRAVTRNYTYSMKRPKNGWGVTTDFRDGIKRSWQSAWIPTERKIKVAREKYIANYKGDKEVARRRSFAVLYHQINREAARQLGWEYSKTRN